MWYKAYCLQTVSHRPSRYSPTLFVDLVNEKDIPVSQQILNLSTLQTGGKIPLPDKLPEGYYWLRAYTKNVLQQDSNDIFVKPIYLINPTKKDSLRDTETGSLASISDNSDPRLIFFPEGGSIISGTNSLVAFRAEDTNGNPVDVSGTITDSKDSVVAKFKTSLPGLGAFNFYVWKSRKYTAHINWNGKELQFLLPPVDQYASQLSVTNLGNALKVQVSLGDSVYRKNQASYLLGISRDSICYAARGTDMYETTISKTVFPEGMATILLFNDRQQVISERNVYIERSNIRSDISFDRNNYGPREKARMDISITDSSNRPQIAMLSVAVTDNHTARQLDSQNGWQQILWDGIDWPNHVEPTDKPDGYSEAELDLVMLSQKNRFHGWHYQYNSFAQPIVSADSNEVTLLHGKITNKKNEPQPNRIVTMAENLSTGYIFESDTTKADGSFTLLIPSTIENNNLVLQVTDLNGKKQNSKIVIDPYSYPGFVTPVQLKKRFIPAEFAMVKNVISYELDTVIFGKGKDWLKAVTVKGYKKIPVNYDASKRISPYSYIITSDKLQEGGAQALQNALLMVPRIRGGLNEPLLVMDGVVITPSDYVPRDSGRFLNPVMTFLNSIDPVFVDFIEVLTGPEAANYGVRGANGVIVINTTNTLKDRRLAPSVGIAVISRKGYTYASPFEGPDYDKKENRKSNFPDHRSTIYWNSNLVTDNYGKATANFYTADDATTYTVTITGITANGDIIFKQSQMVRNAKSR